MARRRSNLPQSPWQTLTSRFKDAADQFQLAFLLTPAGFAFLCSLLILPLMQHFWDERWLGLHPFFPLSIAAVVFCLLYTGLKMVEQIVRYNNPFSR